VKNHHPSKTLALKVSTQRGAFVASVLNRRSKPIYNCHYPGEIFFQSLHPPMDGDHHQIQLHVESALNALKEVLMA